MYSIKNKPPGRLLVGGCSCTDYCWPTWADYLGTVFSEYMNLAQAGSDNACVVRNLVDHTQSGDTVIILWTGWNRHLKWSDNVFPVPKNAQNHWQYNYERWDKNWLVNFYNPIERLIASMDYIRLIELDSQIKNYNVYHFSAFPWRLGEIEKNEHKHFNSIFNQYQLKNNFLLDISLEEFKKQKNLEYQYSTKYNSADSHPGPWCQYQFLQQLIIPKLNFDIDLNIDPAVLRCEHNLKQGELTEDKSTQSLIKVS